MPGTGDRIPELILGQRRVESRVESGHLRRAGQHLTGCPDTLGCEPVVKGSELTELLDTLENPIVDPGCRPKAHAAVYDPMAHHVHRPRAADRPQLPGQAGNRPLQAVSPGRICAEGDFGSGCGVECRALQDAALERAGSGVENEDTHAVRPGSVRPSPIADVGDVLAMVARILPVP